MRVKISVSELRELTGKPPISFPKYATQLMNLANQNAQGTRPKIVGQMSALIQQFEGRTLEEWEEWYLQQKPDGIELATGRVWTMVQALRESLAHVDESMVRQWVEDLVIVKTYVGLRFQQAILARLGQLAGMPVTQASPQQEALGIDGFVGSQAISIKPDSYGTTLAANQEAIQGMLVTYAKKDDGLVLEFEPWW